MDAVSPRPSAPPKGAADDLPFERATLLLGFALLAVAGWIDGVGFVRWSGLYASFMSGNSAQFGAAPAVADWDGTAKAGRAIAMFVVGVVGGELVAGPAGRWRGPAIVTLSAALLWLAAAAAMRGWGEAATTASAGLAMGAQTAAVHRADGVSVALTYVTGTLVNFGRGTAAALRGEKPFGEVLPFAGFWLSLVGGSLAGGSAARAGVDVALVVAAGISSALAVYAGALAGFRKA